MTKLAVFGDSFANLICKENKTAAWFQQLDQKFTVINFGEPGSCLYYSLDQFLKQQDNFDRVIFFVTTIGRLPVPEHQLFEFNNQTQHSVNEKYARRLLESSSLPHRQKFLTAVLDYYQYVQNDQYDQHVHQLMRQEIIAVRPDTLIIDYDDIYHVYEKENQHYELTALEIFNHYRDRRHCHLTPENNQILAKNIDQWLNNGQWQWNQIGFQTPSTAKNILFQRLP